MIFKFKPTFIFILLLTGIVFFCSADAWAQTRVLVVVGAAGTEEYGEQFQEWADHWKTAAAEGRCEFQLIGTADSAEPDTTDLEKLESAFSTLAESDQDAWVILIGHGTFDGQRAKFNLNGPDVTAEQMQKWLAKRHKRKQKKDDQPDQPKQPEPKTIIINCASSSGPFINKLGGRNRIVVTSTKSGYQFNFARFGKFMSQAINDPSVDLDKDQQTSLLEAFLAASRETQAFYETEKRLATEFALLDDNGDGKATPAEWFQGTRVIRRSKDGTPADGLRSNQVFLIRRGDELKLKPEQIKNRDALEAQLEAIRQRKNELGDRSYYQTIEPILIQLAELYAESEK